VESPLARPYYFSIAYRLVIDEVCSAEIPAIDEKMDFEEVSVLLLHHTRPVPFLIGELEPAGCRRITSKITPYPHGRRRSVRLTKDEHVVTIPDVSYFLELIGMQYELHIRLADIETQDVRVKARVGCAR
jgi:hypothetical protein